MSAEATEKVTSAKAAFNEAQETYLNAVDKYSKVYGDLTQNRKQQKESKNDYKDHAAKAQQLYDENQKLDARINTLKVQAQDTGPAIKLLQASKQANKTQSEQEEKQQVQADMKLQGLQRTENKLMKTQQTAFSELKKNQEAASSAANDSFNGCRKSFG